MSESFESHSSLPPELFEHYASGYEAQRLQSGSSQIELARTQEMVMRYVPARPAVIFDDGGGPGVYACWLAKQGYEVHLVDATPLHVELARQASQAQPDVPLASIEVGDARSLKRPDESCDMVLMFGPLYHLTERVDRLKALREAHRVLRSGGLLLAVGISRFTSALDGLRQGLFDDPKELQSEVEESGFLNDRTLPVEGPLWLSHYVVANFGDQKRREQLLALARRLDEEPSLLGASAHMLVVARKA